MQWNATLIIIIYSCSYCFSCWVLHNLLLKQKKELQFNNSPKVYAVFSIVGVGLSLFILEWVFDLLTGNTFQFGETTYGARKYIGMILRALLLSSLNYFILYHLYILQEKQKHTVEIAQLRQAQLEANLSSLKEQLSPHFLFNTLNTLSSITQEKNIKAYVAELASVYRYVLMHKKMDTATLGQELAFTESYLYIIKTRMGDAIEISIHVNDQLGDTLLAPFTLQLLIENAIKHNVASVARRLKIDIYDAEEDYIIVTNKLQPKLSTLHSTGIGLDNIMQRYQLLFGKDILIERTEVAFTVKLPIIRP